MKTGKILAGALAAAMSIAVPSLMAESTPPEAVLKAAADGLQPFIAKIPADSMEQYGFSDGAAGNAAELGAPFLLNTITPQALEKYQAGMTVASLVTPTTLWYFPVLVGGQIRAILVVDRLNNQWQAVSLGYAGLAKELDTLSRQWKAADGYHPMLIVVFQAQQYLFSVPEKDAYNLTRLSASKAPTVGPAAPFSDYTALGTAAGVIDQLKPAVQKALKGANR